MHQRLARPLWRARAAVLIVVVLTSLAACSGGGGDDGAVGAGLEFVEEGDGPAADGTAGNGGGNGANGANGSGGRDGSPDNAADGDGPGGLGPITPGKPVPPKPGEYRLITTSQEEGKAEQRRPVRLTVQSRQQSGGGTRRVLTRSDDNAPLHYVWTAARAVLDISASDNPCNWDPDLLTYQFPLEVGATWSTDSSCTTSDPTRPAVRAHITDTATVTRLQRGKKDGEVVDGYLIDHQGTLELTDVVGANAILREDYRSTEFFVPRHGLALRVTRSSVFQGPTRRETRSTKIDEFIDFTPQ